MGDFDAFWSAYPRREARLDAIKAYAQARKIASAEDILAGVERYKRTMPEEKRYRPLPASWLRAGRWMDEEDEPVAVKYPDCDHVPKCNSHEWCHAIRQRDKERAS